MATFGGLMEWLGAAKAPARREKSDFRLRALPREDILLYVKDIDNTGVERVADTRETLASVGMAGGVIAASVLVIALMLPGTYSLVVSHRIESLKQEREQLVNTLRSVRADRARLESPAQVEHWAGREFVAPAANAVLYAAPGGETVAKLSGGE
ncbi:MAG: hypothetical protein C0504_17560 [Candidatus Solibacter sp.]|nr:hypothetical protein [Candidatus Solibacter sp.]